MKKIKKDENLENIDLASVLGFILVVVLLIICAKYFYDMGFDSGQENIKRRTTIFVSTKGCYEFKDTKYTELPAHCLSYYLNAKPNIYGEE